MERDEGRILTDEQLIELEKEIRRAYAAAAVELMETIDAHFARFEKKDTEMRRLMEAGQITEDQYLQWRLSYIGRGKRFEELRDKLAEGVTRANELAVSYVNNRLPTIYTLNRNYAGYSVDRGSRWRYDSFTLLDEATVRRLIRDKPDLMPNYPAKRALARGIDLAYGKKQITAAVTSGILQGKGVRRIAADLRERIVSMNVESAIRTARTAVTSAENGGRQDTFEAAAEAGIKVRRRWLATLDSRTRPEHGHADGQERGADEPFIVGGEKLMFPGDKSHGASGWNIYNCRCCLTSATDKRFEKNPMKRRARNPETGEWELIPDMTFDEWQEWKRERAQAAAAKDDAVQLSESQMQMRRLVNMSATRTGEVKSNVKKKQIKQTHISDVQKEYTENAKPGTGNITYGEDYRASKHKEEIKIAQWLHDNLGGDIELLKEKGKNVKTPDYMWKSKQWELKTITSAKAADSALRSAFKQITENPGGVILNCQGDNISSEELNKIIENRVKRSLQFDADIITIKDDKLKSAWRCKK